MGASHGVEQIQALQAENERLRAFAFGDAPEWEKANATLKHRVRELEAELANRVPCDDAAVERAVQALIAEEGDGLTRLNENGARRRVLAVLRAAGAQHG